MKRVKPASRVMRSATSGLKPSVPSPAPPGSESAEQLYEDRTSVQAYDNAALIDEILAAHNEQVRGDGCACALGQRRSAAGSAWALLALALLAYVGRRRGR